MVKQGDMKNPSNRLAIFEDAEIRRILVGDDWFYSVVDVVRALTDSSSPRNYWSSLKKREFESSGIQLSTFCVQLSPSFVRKVLPRGQHLRRDEVQPLPPHNAPFLVAPLEPRVGEEQMKPIDRIGRKYSI